MDGKVYEIDAVIKGKLSSTGQVIKGKLSSTEQTIKGRLSTQIVPDAYTGSYDVIPKIDAQQLETVGKVMKDNVTVWGIPYAEVSNPDGTTVIIGDE